MLSEIIIKDAEAQPQTFKYKLNCENLTLGDQEEALKDPWNAYVFARLVPGADIKRCQEIACKSPISAYCFARFVPGADIEKCQEVACKDPIWAIAFARDVPGADIKKCIPGTDVDRCQEAVNSNTY